MKLVGLFVRQIHWREEGPQLWIWDNASTFYTWELISVIVCKIANKATLFLQEQT
jgi:hypothetical protein